jgi:tRNA pseudouridine55 synthase
MNGILNVDKPVGWSSFDVIRLVRRGTGVERVGHAGTLDPMASGVLVVLLGQAVRVSEYVMGLEKAYRATVRLGISTNTYDAEGEVTAEHPADVTEAELRAALEGFTGEIQQTPPAFSAVKVGGERAYARARRGEDVELKPRTSVVYEIVVVKYSPPDIVLDIRCSRGTYVRSIAHDLGEQLGCGAHLSGLVRTAVGPFAVERAVGETSLRSALEDGSWRELVQPTDCGLLALPAITLGIEDEKDLRYGRAVDLDTGPESSDGGEARAYAEDGSLIGIIRWDNESRMWRPRKVFDLASR